ncbi:TetR/AcrR family transcriptional regulator [Nocardia colli]|uniref:TetR/AcrR family transcriptional regulator n=1 Tax=Nocardia colli TaxID=2545717 RepID=UPI00168CC183|nr:TetR/AcrR family transcriptional regulator [Nocardia colli]
MSRTQRERRETTIAKLLDASIEIIDELGYARASVTNITARAGLSYGALFRHFPTMSDFMAATAHEAVRRQVEATRKRFREVAGRAGRTDMETSLEVLRELAGRPTHTAILELTMAARTDPFLRASLQQAMRDVGPLMIETAREMVGHETDLGYDDAITLVFMVSDLFDSEVFQRPLREPHPRSNTRRVALLLRMLEPFGRRAVDPAE